MDMKKLIELVMNCNEIVNLTATANVLHELFDIINKRHYEIKLMYNNAKNQVDMLIKVIDKMTSLNQFQYYFIPMRNHLVCLYSVITLLKNGHTGKYISNEYRDYYWLKNLEKDYRIDKAEVNQDTVEFNDEKTRRCTKYFDMMVRIFNAQSKTCEKRVRLPNNIGMSEQETASFSKILKAASAKIEDDCNDKSILHLEELTGSIETMQKTTENLYAELIEALIKKKDLFKEINEDTLLTEDLSINCLGQQITCGYLSLMNDPKTTINDNFILSDNRTHRILAENKITFIKSPEKKRKQPSINIVIPSDGYKKIRKGNDLCKEDEKGSLEIIGGNPSHFTLLTNVAEELLDNTDNNQNANDDFNANNKSFESATSCASSITCDSKISVVNVLSSVSSINGNSWGHGKISSDHCNSSFLKTDSERSAFECDDFEADVADYATAVEQMENNDHYVLTGAIGPLSTTGSSGNNHAALPVDEEVNHDSTETKEIVSPRFKDCINNSKLEEMKDDMNVASNGTNGIEKLPDNKWLRSIKFQFLDPANSLEVNFKVFKIYLTEKILTAVKYDRDMFQLAIEYFVLFFANLDNAAIVRPTLFKLFIDLKTNIYKALVEERRLYKQKESSKALINNDADDNNADEEDESVCSDNENDGDNGDEDNLEAIKLNFKKRNKEKDKEEDNLEAIKYEYKKLIIKDRQEKNTLQKSVKRAVTRVAVLFFEAYHQRLYQNDIGNPLRFLQKVEHRYTEVEFIIPKEKFKLINQEELHELAYSLTKLDKKLGQYMLFTINKEVTMDEKHAAYRQKIEALMCVFDEGPKTPNVVKTPGDKSPATPKVAEPKKVAVKKTVEVDLSYLSLTNNRMNMDSCISHLVQELGCDGPIMLLMANIKEKFFSGFMDIKNLALQLKLTKEQFYDMFCLYCKDNLTFEFLLESQKHFYNVTSPDGYCSYRMMLQFHLRMFYFKRDKKLCTVQELKKYDINLVHVNNRDYFKHMLQTDLTYLKKAINTDERHTGPFCALAVDRLAWAIEEIDNYNKITGNIKLPRNKWGNTNTAMYLFCEQYDFPMVLFQQSNLPGYFAMTNYTLGKNKEKNFKAQGGKSYKDIVTALSTPVLNFGCLDSGHFYPIESDIVPDYITAINNCFNKLAKTAFILMLRYDCSLVRDKKDVDYDLTEPAVGENSVSRSNVEMDEELKGITFSDINLNTNLKAEISDRYSEKDDASTDSALSRNTNKDKDKDESHNSYFTLNSDSNSDNNNDNNSNNNDKSNDKKEKRYNNNNNNDNNNNDNNNHDTNENNFKPHSPDRSINRSIIMSQNFESKFNEFIQVLNRNNVTIEELRELSKQLLKEIADT